MLRLGLVDEAAWAVREATKALQQAQADLRESITAFRTADAGPEQWAEGLRQFVQLYERQWGIQCELRIGEGVAEACGAIARVELARILQEALTNVRKHANAKRVAVTILIEGGIVVARVVDWGRGFDPTGCSRDITACLRCASGRRASAAS